MHNHFRTQHKRIWRAKMSKESRPLHPIRWEKYNITWIFHHWIGRLAGRQEEKPIMKSLQIVKGDLLYRRPDVSNWDFAFLMLTFYFVLTAGSSVGKWFSRLLLSTYYSDASRILSSTWFFFFPFKLTSTFNLAIPFFGQQRRRRWFFCAHAMRDLMHKSWPICVMKMDSRQQPPL